MRFSFSLAQGRFLAGLFTNLSAGWLGVIFITPNFSDLNNPKDQFHLIYSIVSVIMYSVLAIRLEEKLDEYE